ncbi:MAG: type III pantothenate kinase [Sedimentisphaerales bacterium]|nr:type III pantothenate kinase [Sedimentisphaerales bacterium]
MNIIAVDIGNTNITIALFVDDTQSGLEKVPGSDTAKITEVLKAFWEKVPVSKASKDKKRDGHIVIASVNPEWTEQVKKIVKKTLDEKALEIGEGKDVPLPMKLDVKDPAAIGVDRVVNAFAAYSVVGDAVIVADFGTAVTIDLVSNEGVFLGGVIFPGFDMSADALNRHTAALPKIGKIVQPVGKPYGRSTAEAINNGLYYAAIGAIEILGRVYSEEANKWPQTIATGGNMDVIKSGCDFVDSFVTNLCVKGVVLAYKKYLGEKT